MIPSQSVQADHVVTVSQWSKNDIARHLCFSQDQISVVPPGVDPNAFSELFPSRWNGIDQGDRMC